jgi:formate dehydrogenase
MNARVIPIAPVEPVRQRMREGPQGRRASADALTVVRQLLAMHRGERDLLIEHLHLLQDRFNHLSADHLAALAQEMQLPQAEVYEVASFYHHFDIVKEGERRRRP